MDKNSLSELILAFLEEKAYQGATPKTLVWYRDILTRFVGDSGLITLEDLTYAAVVGWFTRKRSQLDSEGRRLVSDTSLATYDRAIRVFLNWLYRRGHLTHNFLAQEPKLKAPKQQVHPFTLEEIRAILEAAKEPPNARRKTAEVLVMLDTGIRAGELVSLTLDDIDWRGGLLWVRGKSGERIVPFSNKSARALKIYIDRERRPLQPVTAQVFLVRGKPMTVDALTQEVIRIVRRAGIDRRRIGPHTFRHTFAAEYVKAGGDLASLKAILGHSRVEITMKYVWLSQKELKEIHLRFSLLERLLL